MGQLFQKKSEYDDNKNLQDLLFQLKKKNLKDIFECIEYIDQVYPTRYRLIYKEFDDAFGSLMDDTKPLFERLQEFKMADVYESLACFCLFSGDTFENKCAFVFKLFDFDNSNSLERGELVKTIDTVLRAICKSVGLPLPKQEYLESMANALFVILDQDQSQHIDFQEFLNWIYSNFDFQDFLLKYSGTQTYHNAKRRMHQLLEKFDQKFSEMSQGQYELKAPIVWQLLQNEMIQDFDKEMIEYLYKVIEETTIRFLQIAKGKHFMVQNSNQMSSPAKQQNHQEQNTQQQQQPQTQDSVIHQQQQEELKKNSDDQQQQAQTDSSPQQQINIIQIENLNISKTDYIDIMKAWCAYSASDINKQNRLSINELKILLWVYEDQEPTEFKLREEMRIIDADQSMTIERQEWINYLCQEQRTGGQVFKSNMRKIFDKFEQNQGTVSYIFLKDILVEIFFQKIKNQKSSKILESVSKLVDQLHKDILKDLQHKNLTQFNWVEFRGYMDVAIQKNEQLCKFLDQII